MPDILPTIEFFAGLSEELSNVSLRRGKESGDRQVVLTFQKLKAIEKFQSFTKQFNGNLRLKDSEGEITINPSSVKFFCGDHSRQTSVRNKSYDIGILVFYSITR